MRAAEHRCPPHLNTGKANKLQNTRNIAPKKRTCQMPRPISAEWTDCMVAAMEYFQRATRVKNARLTTSVFRVYEYTGQSNWDLEFDQVVGILSTFQLHAANPLFLTFFFSIGVQAVCRITNSTLHSLVHIYLPILHVLLSTLSGDCPRNWRPSPQFGQPARAFLSPHTALPGCPQS